MTHDDDTIPARQQTADRAERFGDGEPEVELVDHRDLSGGPTLPFPKPPPVPDFSLHRPARRETAWVGDAPAAGGSVAPVAMGRTAPPPAALELEQARRSAGRRAALAACLMAVPVVAMFAAAAIDSDDKGHVSRAAQAQAGLARHALELHQASARPPRAEADTVREPAAAGTGFVASLTVPETVIVGMLRPSPHAESDAPSGAPAASAELDVVTTGGQGIQAAKLARTVRPISPVDEPLGTDPTAVPGATQFVVEARDRPVVPSTESQTPPTRLEPDHVAARGKLDTRR